MVKYSILNCRPGWKIMPYNTYKTTNVFCVCNLDILQLIVFLFTKASEGTTFIVAYSIPAWYNFSPKSVAGYVEPHGKDFTFCDVLERCGGLCVLCYACAAAAQHLFTRMARVLVLVVEVRIYPGSQTESQWRGGCCSLGGRWMKMMQGFMWMKIVGNFCFVKGLIEEV